jgi:hypothetical protein
MAPDPEEQSEREVEQDATHIERDPITARETLEQDLMEEHESEAGEVIGDQMP